MCGITGFINNEYSYENLVEITNSIAKRGPDGAGYFFENQVGLGHRRLSIIELSELGTQPYRFENLVLVFNGEIYNYQEIKIQLISKGYSFISNSDTEVLIKAFHYWRDKAVNHFIGMFAFAIYDTTTEELFLFRDRLGVKPLYYSLTDGIVFGSEFKVFKSLPINNTIDKNSVYQYFKFGYISNDNTIYEKVKKLLPGHYLKYHKGTSELIKYWAPEKKSDNDDEKIIQEKLEELLISSFKYRMVSEVPVGVFLSGGIDSSLVASILQKEHGNISTFTIGFNQNSYNEAPYAKKVATALETSHHEYILDAKKAKDLLFDFYEIYDEPFSDSSGIPTALISKIAREQGVKVVLSADGGDELFCGYTHYNKIANYINRFYAPLSSKNRIQDFLITTLNNSKLLRNCNYLNLEHKMLAYQDLIMSNDIIKFYENSIANQAEEELTRLIDSKQIFNSKRHQSFNLNNPIEQMMHWDLLHYLPDDLLVKVDRATMYNGVEGREPFLDHRLVEFSYALPFNLKYQEGNHKYILKKILNNYLPEQLFNRPKMGFSIPIFKWFSEDLHFLFEEYLSEKNIAEIGFLNYKEIQKEYSKFKYYIQKGQDYNIEKMWRILSFVMWWKKWGKS